MEKVGKWKQMLGSKLFENFVSLGLIQAINYLIPLVLIPVLYNRLGVEKYGLVNFSFAFIQYFIVLTDFGFGLSGTRYIAEHRDDPKKMNRYLCSATLSRLLLCAVSMVILLVCVATVPKFAQYKWFTLLFFGQVIGQALYPSWFFQGMEQMKFNTLVYVTVRVLSLTPLFFVIHGPEDYIYMPVFYSAGAILAGVISLLIIRYSFRMRLFFTSLREIWAVTRDSANYFLSRVSVSIYTNTNTFLLGLVCGNIPVGYYSLANKIYVALNSMYGPVNGAIFPYMTRRKDLVLFKKILYGGIVLNGLMLLAFYFLFPLVTPWLFDDFAPETNRVLHILMLSNFISLPSTFLGYPFLAAWGHPNFCNLSLVASSVFHLVGLAILFVTHTLSIYSVAMLVVACEGFLLLFRIYGVRRFGLWKKENPSE